MSSAFHYTAYGLRVESDIELPEFIAASHTGPSDVQIRRGLVPTELNDASSSGVVYQANDRQFLLALDGVARFLVEDGSKITIEPAEGSLASDVRVFLLGSCLGAMLQQQGVLPLHASAIRTDAGAVLFVGDSGAGKSTTLNAFLARGYAMMSDDIAGVVLDHTNYPVVLPAFPRTKLWADSALRLGHDISSLQRVRPQQEKYEIHAHDQFANEVVPLHRVYHLTTTNSDELTVEPVENLNRFNVMLANTYRVGFLRGLGLRPAHFQMAAVTGNKTSVMRVIRPQNPSRIEELIDLIEHDFKVPQPELELRNQSSGQEYSHAMLNAA